MKMKKSALSFAASAACLLAASASVNAAQLVYGFNTTDTPARDGFVRTYQSNTGGSVTSSTTTGVSEGDASLNLHIGATGTTGVNTGYTQFDSLLPGSVTAAPALVNSSSASLDLTFTPPAGLNYIRIDLVFFLEGGTNPDNGPTDRKLTPDATAAGQPYLGGQTYNKSTLNYNLKAYLDPNAGDGFDTNSPTTLYTPAEIAAANQVAYPGSAITGFGFEIIESGSSTPLDFYIDNLSVPTPEPTCVAALALSGVALMRRRKA